MRLQPQSETDTQQAELDEFNSSGSWDRAPIGAFLRGAHAPFRRLL